MVPVRAALLSSYIFRTSQVFKTPPQFLRGGVHASALMLCTLLLASCGAVQAPPVAGVAANPYEITEVEVTISKTAVYGAEMVDGSSPQELGKKIQAALKRKLTAELAQPKTKKIPARLVVELKQLDMSSGVGRALMNSTSQIGGDVTLLEKRTKNVIARQENLGTGDNSLYASGGGDGKAGTAMSIAALAINVAQSGEEDRIASVVNPFAAQIKAWLGQPE
jgi:hypothetical protein